MRRFSSGFHAEFIHATDHGAVLAEPFIPRGLAERRSPVELSDQFVLSRTVAAPEGWTNLTLGTWTLAHHPTLAVVSIDDDRGVQVGWLLGYPVTSDGELLTTGSHVTLTAGVQPDDLVGDIGGRFLAIFIVTATPSIYPDACGSYSSVYCPVLEMAASTPALIPYDTATTDRTELIEQLGIPWTNSMYPVGLTPRHGIHRLLPHHHLDLDRWVVDRHGPNWRPSGTTTAEEAAHHIARITTRNIGAIIERFPCYLPLTAGRDSRMLLACARQWTSDLELYTLDLPGLVGANDRHVAAQIARTLGLEHHIVPNLPARNEDLEIWMHRIAYSVGEPRGWQATTARRTLDTNRVRLAANIGDIARRAYATPADSSDSVITPDRLVVHALRHRGTLTAGQAAASASPVILEQLEHWIDQAGTTDALQLLDMFYLENRIGSWAGVFPYADYYGPGFTIFPMCHRDVVANMMEVPHHVRQEGSLLVEVTRQAWPELLAWPFNAPTRQLRVRGLPSAAKRRLRKATTNSRLRSTRD